MLRAIFLDFRINIKNYLGKNLRFEPTLKIRQPVQIYMYIFFLNLGNENQTSM